MDGCNMRGQEGRGLEQAGCGVGLRGVEQVGCGGGLRGVEQAVCVGGVCRGSKLKRRLARQYAATVCSVRQTSRCTAIVLFVALRLFRPSPKFPQSLAGSVRFTPPHPGPTVVIVTISRAHLCPRVQSTPSTWRAWTRMKLQRTVPP
eukprot:360247-Chlamydomonas_euryale.AAC.4